MVVVDEGDVPFPREVKRRHAGTLAGDPMAGGIDDDKEERKAGGNWPWPPAAGIAS